MIIKHLYLYWTNADWLWKTEKFMLFLLVTASSSIFNGIMTYHAVAIFGPWAVSPALMWFGFLASGLTWVYFISRWCRYCFLESNSRLDIRTGKISGGWFDERNQNKIKLKELENEQARDALYFASSLKK